MRIAIVALLAGCSSELPAAYSVQYAGPGGAGLSATVPAPVDLDGARAALAAVAAPLAMCAPYRVEVRGVDCKPPKDPKPGEEPKPGACVVSGALTCGGAP